MAIIVNGRAGDFLESGSYNAVCSHVIDLGIQKKTFRKKNGESEESEVREILFIFELDKTYEHNGEKKRNVVSKRYTASVSKKSNLYRDLQSWLNNSITDEMIEKGIDLEKLVGRTCYLEIEVKKSEDGKDFTVIKEIFPSKMLMIPVRKKDDYPDWVNEIILRGKSNVLQSTQSAINDPWGNDPWKNIPSEPQEQYDDIPF